MRRAIVGVVLAGLVGVAAAPALAGERYALIVSGASGDEKYAQTYDKWRAQLSKLLTGKFGFDAARVVVLSEASTQPGLTSTAENLRRTVGSLKASLAADDLLFVVLIGHGTYDGTIAKFNLVGPDLDAEGWRALFDGLRGRLILVNTTASSFPFLDAISGPNRIVITATDSPAQRYETTFPEFFVKAMDDPTADLDKNGRISLLEAFIYASAGVKQYYEQRGQLATERPLLDDDGDHRGKEAGAPGPDGALAGSTYFDRDLGASAAGGASAELVRRRDRLVADVEQLKGKKGSMKEEEYYAALEKLLVEIAMIGRQIKSGS
ncbi:MAG: caspase family protein [Acidobacteria bacterium]|nr:caspase family protein [Acidobacteriota bacterium]